MLSWGTAIKRNGKFTAMLPVKPGSFTFNLAVITARTSNTENP
jgi:hypothetical protein